MKLRLVGGMLGVTLGMFVGLVGLAPSALASASVSFGTPQLVGGGISLQSIACGSVDTCLAVGYSSTPDSGYTDTNSYVIPVTDGVAGTPVAVPPVATPSPGLATPGFQLELTDLVCVSSSTCYAVGSYYPGDSTLLEYGGGVVVTITNGVPSAPELIQSSTPDGWGNSTQLGLTGISCWSTSGCEAVGTLTGVDSPAGELTNYGIAASILDGVPQSVATDTGTFDFSSVECFASSACDILGNAGNAGGGLLVGLNGGAFVNPQASASLNDNSWTFACSSATSCLIVPTNGGDLYQTLTNNTTIGPAVTSTFAVAGHSGSCPTTTVCWIVGGRQGQTVVEPIVSDVAQTTTASNVGQLVGVACTSATSCLAITSAAIMPFTATISSTSSTGSGSGSGSGSSSGSGSGSSSGSSARPLVTLAKPTQKDGVTKVAIHCRDAKCSLKLTETVKINQNKKTKLETKLETVASKTVTLAAGESAVESLKLNALGAKTLKRTKDNQLKTTLTITLDGKRVSIKTLTLTIGKTKKA